ncbi:MAG: Ldh family oxidoreductase [Alphaproteobacteria bacterium]|nr:Ldh family oxidoreductase [Alphaproteobacteria bacterium]
MRLTVAEARDLLHRTMTALGHDAAEAAVIADHLLDCELRGLGYGGLARAVSIAERMAAGGRREPIRVLRETPLSAVIDGGDNLGYLVARQATELAIAKAEAQGLAMIAGNRTWYTGMLSYYAEMLTGRDLVGMLASNATAWVAPHGANEGRFGTNPVCFGFPTGAQPIIWDIGTSAIMHAEVVLHRRLGTALPEGVAFAPDGRPTRDPAAALAGAFAAWGGHRGSGLGLVVQMLGMLAGSPAMPAGLADFGFVILALRPDLFVDTQQFKREIAAYAETVRAARPVAGGEPVRMPFDRSAAARRRRLAEDAIEVPDLVHERLTRIATRNASVPP